MTQTKRFLSVVLGLCIVVAGCTSSGDDADALHRMARTLAQDGVGVVVAVQDHGSTHPAIIIEEMHTSLTGNVEIATMLYRLYRDYGVTRMGTEGAFDDLDATWYHAAFASDPDAQSVIIQLLAEGEISSVELIALMLPGVTVFGLEDRAEYDANLVDSQAGGAAVTYLVAMAAQNMTAQQRTEADTIYTEQGFEAYLDYVLAFDQWAQARYEVLYGVNAVPASDLVRTLDAVIERADAFGLTALAEFDVYALGLQRERAYLVGVDQRTHTMFDRFAAAYAATDQPLPVVVGVAHTADLARMLDAAGISYIVLQAASLAGELEDAAPLPQLDDAALQRKFNGFSVDQASGVGALFDNRATDGAIRPVPSINNTVVLRKTAAYLLFHKLAATFTQAMASGDTDFARMIEQGGVNTAIENMNMRIEPSSVQPVAADPGQPLGPDNMTFVFKVEVGVLNGLPGETFWAKLATRPADPLPGDPEQALLQLRQSIRTQRRPTLHNSAVIPISPDILVAVGRTLAQVENQVMK